MKAVWMSWALVISLGLFNLVAQEIPMPPPGNPDHIPPGPGQFCAHTGGAAHECACQAKCVTSEDEQGNEVTYRQEDPKCRSYCFKTHCHCPSPCEP